MTQLPRKPYNPKAPHRRVQTHDVTSAKDAFVERLRILGAAPDVLATVTENWDDPEWVERDDVMALGDEALRAELAAIETEYHEGTVTEEEDELAARQALEAQAAEMLPEPVPVVTRWVESDPEPPARAYAVEALEAQAAKPRTTLLAAVAVIIAEHEGE